MTDKKQNLTDLVRMLRDELPGFTSITLDIDPDEGVVYLKAGFNIDIVDADGIALGVSPYVELESSGSFDGKRDTLRLACEALREELGVARAGTIEVSK